MRRLKLTVATIRKECRPPSPGETTSFGKPLRERIYWDTQDHGFGLRVRPHRNGSGLNASFILQRDLNGKPVKVTIGRLGVWTPEQARKRARELTVEMDRGLDPNAEKRRARASRVTLADAVVMHVDDMRAMDRAERSVQDVLTETKKHLSDWLSRPLPEITGADCRCRHKKLTDQNGPYVANRVLRHLSACWNTAARVHPDISERSPTKAVAFNRERPRNNPILWNDLPAWWAAVHEIANPVLRDLHLFYLFTGLRRNDGKSIRWEHIDFNLGTIHRPRPKGGIDRAFTVPAATFVLDLLRRRREENHDLFPDGDDGWVFPSRDRSGRVIPLRDAREQRYDEDGKKIPSHLPNPHRLRHTFATGGHEAFLRELDLKLLMNHRAPRGNVTYDYIRVSTEHLRECAEKIAAFLLTKADSPRLRLSC